MAEKKKPKDQLTDMLTDPLKRSRQANDPLVRLWRQFMTRELVTPSKWSALIADHINRLRSFKTMDVQSIGTERGNLKKAFIEKSTMSFSALRRGLRFLGFVKVTIIVIAERPSGEKVEEQVTIDLVPKRMFGDRTPTQPAPNDNPGEKPPEK